MRNNNKIKTIYIRLIRKHRNNIVHKIYVGIYSDKELKYIVIDKQKNGVTG